LGIVRQGKARLLIPLPCAARAPILGTSKFPPKLEQVNITLNATPLFEAPPQHKHRLPIPIPRAVRAPNLGVRVIAQQRETPLVHGLRQFGDAAGADRAAGLPETALQLFPNRVPRAS